MTCKKTRLSGNLFTFLILCGLILFSSKTQAQDATTVIDSAKNALLDSTRVWPPDSLGRRTPNGTVEGFLRAVAAKDYNTAVLYLNVNSTKKKKDQNVRLAQTFGSLIEEKGRILPYSRISEEIEGHKDDNLSPELERIGEATVGDKTFDLILEHTRDKDGSPIWLFSSQTLLNVPVDTVQVQEATVIEKVSPHSLLETKWGAVPVAHWLAILIIIILAYFVAGFITRAIVYIIPLVWRRAREEATAGIIQSFIRPIQIYLGVWFFVVASRQIGISLLIRQRLSDVTIIVGFIAVLLLFWQLLDFISNLTERRLRYRGNHSGISALLFLKRAAKVALVVLGILIILDTLGFDVTTWLTALGIGGIALALGTQKTVENLVGSVTIIADRPLRVGDFCKAGDVTGTVEQIGMRTTQIRTGARTIVSIPNGELSSTKIENFAPRDKFLFNPIFGLRYETTPDQIRYLLVEIREILKAHPKMDPNVARVRFISLGADALNLEVFAYIMTTDNDEFLEIQEELLLKIMDVVEASGTAFAFRSQTVYFAQDPGVSEEKSKSAEEKVKSWRDADGVD
jgi:MscS family membrane protein